MAAVAMVLLLHATIAPEPVYASFCCEDCERNESACYAACNSSGHAGGEDTVQACYDACYYQLYEKVGACFLHCDFDCGPPHEPQCFDCFVTGHGPHDFSCQNYTC